MDESYAEVGTKVILGRHGPVGHERNWASSMDLYVGKTATIISVHGKDISGYMCCRVAEYPWAWQVRNMILVSDVPLLTPEQKRQLNIEEDDG